MTTAATKREIKDRQSIADHVATWMYNNARSLSIDTLLTRPLDAMRMGAEVAVMSGRLSGRSARRIIRALNALTKGEGPAIDSIDEVCRAALSSRKRGDLKRDAH